MKNSNLHKRPNDCLPGVYHISTSEQSILFKGYLSIHKMRARYFLSLPRFYKKSCNYIIIG